MGHPRLMRAASDDLQCSTPNEKPVFSAHGRAIVVNEIEQSAGSGCSSLRAIAPGSKSAADTGASSYRRCRCSSGRRLGRIRRVGSDAATSTGERSIFFAPNAAAAARCDSRSNAACGRLVSDDCASGFEVVASLGRRRTSTVNEGTAQEEIAALGELRLDLGHVVELCGAYRRELLWMGKQDRPLVANPIAEMDRPLGGPSGEIRGSVVNARCVRSSGG